MRKIGLVVVLAFLLGAVYFSIFGFRTASVESLRELTSQNVQIGATPEEVIHFLASRRLQPSPLFKPQVMSMNGHDYSGQNIVLGVKRYSARALLCNEAIYLVFVFDEDHKLVRYDFLPIYDDSL
jgi:hypothetical protein